jgi:hypothetical protein
LGPPNPDTHKQRETSGYGIFISDFTSKEANVEYFGLPVGKRICRTDHQIHYRSFGVATVGLFQAASLHPIKTIAGHAALGSPYGRKRPGRVDNALAPTTLHVTLTSKGPLLVSNLYMAGSKIPHCNHAHDNKRRQFVSRALGIHRWRTIYRNSKHHLESFQES